MHQRTQSSSCWPAIGSGNSRELLFCPLRRLASSQPDQMLRRLKLQWKQLLPLKPSLWVRTSPPA